jgi:HK97 family phage prohead protease
MQRLTNRLVINDGESSVSGLAAPYYDGTPDSQTILPDGTIERLMPGCFDACLDKIKRGEMTTHCYFNHNTDKSLGATPETLSLWSDKDGLHFACSLDMDDPDAQKLNRGAKRKEFKGTSFGADTNLQTGMKYSRENGRLVRSIHSFSRLWDISPVYLPVYHKTGFTIRSLEKSLEEINGIEAEAAAWFADQAAMEETKRRIERNKNLRH